MPETFGARLSTAFREKGQLCIGIDPHPSVLREWGLEDNFEGLREFSMLVMHAAADQVGIVKPQVAFFERFGAAGMDVLASVSNRAHDLGLLVIADAKRGDIGTTMDAYFEAWFGSRSGLFADAVTVSPFLGLSAVTDGLGAYLNSGKGVFSLVATSNPEGKSVQMATVGLQSLAASQLQQLDNLNGAASIASHHLGSYGAVIGGTLDFSEFGLETAASNTPILAPGFGAQGASLNRAMALFGERTPQVCFSVSRSVLFSGPGGLSSAISSTKDQLEQGLSG